jgi:hypothetical protein
MTNKGKQTYDMESVPNGTAGRVKSAPKVEIVTAAGATGLRNFETSRQYRWCSGGIERLSASVEEQDGND